VTSSPNNGTSTTRPEAGSIQVTARPAVAHLLDLLGDTFDTCDGDGAVIVLKALRLVAGDAFTDALVLHLITIGTRRMIERSGGNR